MGQTVVTVDPYIDRLVLHIKDTGMQDRQCMTADTSLFPEKYKG